MTLNISKSVAELNQELAAYVIQIANTEIASKGSFNFVLTGGSSPITLYKELSTTFKNKIDWSKVFFFFGDERNVLSNHKDYNGLMAKENLFDNLETPENHIFYIDTTLNPKDAALAYKKALDHHFNGKEIIFDLILLGMGDDAHTASIFPETELIKSHEATVQSVFVEKLAAYRISFTAPLINNAKNIAFIAFGPNKANALKNILNNTQKDYFIYPAQLIKPINGHLTWFVDEDAASLLAL